MARRKRRTRSPRARRSQQNLRGILLIAGVAVLSALAVYYNFALQGPDYNADTLCPETGPLGVTVVLVDRSDALEPVQTMAVRNELHRLKDNLPRHERLDVYALEAGQDLPRPQLSLCNPGSGEEASFLTENPERIRRHWEEGFAQTVEAKIEDLLAEGEANRSPLMEAIRAVSVQSFLPLDEAIRARRLVVISDMIQHTDAFSQYRSSAPYQQVRQQAQSRGLVPNLQGVEVQILYVRRPAGTQVQGGDHVRFWQDYFLDAGGLLSAVTSI